MEFDEDENEDEDEDEGDGVEKKYSRCQTWKTLDTKEL